MTNEIIVAISQNWLILLEFIIVQNSTEKNSPPISSMSAEKTIEAYSQNVNFCLGF